MTRALPFLLLLAGCTLHSPHGTAQSCSSNRQCDNTELCFLGECRGRSAALSLVYAEVRPPSDSQLAQVQRAGIDLHQSVVLDFALSSPLTFSGAVRQDQTSGSPAPLTSSSQVAFVQRDAVLPDRAQGVTARTDASTGAFSAHLPPGVYDVAVTPPPPLPPIHGYPSLSVSQTGLDLRVPQQSLFVSASGTLTLNGAAVDGARVTAVDATGVALSSPATTSAGNYSLLLPPGTSSYALQIGPTASSASDLPSYDSIVPSNGAVALTAPASATVSGVVTDSSGAAIGGARVYALNVDSVPWKMLRSTTADASGAYSLALREGAWLLEAVPGSDPNVPGIAGVVVQVTAPGITKDIACPLKLSATGVVLRPDGIAVGAGYTVNATRLPDNVVTGRTAWTTSTDSAGLFHLIGDQGLYRIEIVPPQATGLPRKIVEVLIQDQGQSLPVIQLAQPVEVVGRVHGAPPGGADAAISGATVDFFALDSTGTRSILLGTGVTDAQGDFRAVLPDVPSPGIAPP